MDYAVRGWFKFFLRYDAGLEPAQDDGFSSGSCNGVILYSDAHNDVWGGFSDCNADVNWSTAFGTVNVNVDSII